MIAFFMLLVAAAIDVAEPAHLRHRPIHHPTRRTSDPTGAGATGCTASKLVAYFLTRGFHDSARRPVVLADGQTPYFPASPAGLGNSRRWASPHLRPAQAP